MHTLYCISGLGADERLFQYLKLENVKVEYIKWISPVFNETITDYATRISAQIDKTKQFSLFGVSLGGLIAIEISKSANPDRIIIISSIKTKNELPWYYRWIGKLSIYRFIPVRIIKDIGIISKYFFGLSNQSEVKLFMDMFKDADKKFLEWAVAQVLKWDNLEIPLHLTHIHGDSDKIFPLKNISNAIRVTGGSHFMIVTKAKEISLKVNNILNQ